MSSSNQTAIRIQCSQIQSSVSAVKFCMYIKMYRLLINSYSQVQCSCMLCLAICCENCGIEGVIKNPLHNKCCLVFSASQQLYPRNLCIALVHYEQLREMIFWIRICSYLNCKVHALVQWLRTVFTYFLQQSLHYPSS